jgi:hypothetical protein
MSLEEHAAFGELLKLFGARQQCDLLNSFTVNSRQYRAVKKFYSALWSLRSVMDDEVCRLIPSDSALEQKYNPLRFYYGDEGAGRG